MNKIEIAKVLKTLAGAGIQFNKEVDTSIVIELWYECFKNDKLQDITKAISEIVQSNEPVFLNGLIGRIKERLVAKDNKFLDFAIAWQLIRDAMHNTHPDIPQETKKAFKSLPAMLQYVVGSAKHLEEMEYCIDRNILETVEKSNLKKIYDGLVTQSKLDLQLGKVPMWKQIQNSQTNKVKLNIAKLLEEKSL